MYVEEDNFFPVSVVVLRSDDVLSSVFQLNPVDDEAVVVLCVSLHELDTLSKLLVVVEPGEGWRCYGYHTTVELNTLSLVGKRTVRFDYEPRCRLPTI